MLGFRVCFWVFPLKPYSASTENSTFFWPLFSAALAWANDIGSLPSPLPSPSPNFAHFCTLPEDEFLNRVFTLTRPCLRSCKVFLCLESAAGAGALPISAHTVGPRACTPAPPRPCSLAAAGRTGPRAPPFLFLLLLCPPTAEVPSGPGSPAAPAPAPGPLPPKAAQHSAVLGLSPCRRAPVFRASAMFVAVSSFPKNRRQLPNVNIWEHVKRQCM